MSNMKVDVEQLKRFSRYHPEKEHKRPEKEHKHSRKRKTEEKGSISKLEKKKKLFPPEQGEELVRDATVDNPYNFSDIQELQTLHVPAATCCRTKQPGQSVACSATATSLELLLLEDVEEVLGKVSQKQPGTVTQHVMPSQEQPGTVTQHALPILHETADEEVITEQPKCTIDDFFPKTTSFTEEVQNLPKLSDVPATAHREIRVNYSGIPMSKQVAERLEQGKKKKRDEIVTVDTSSKKNITCGETYVDVDIDNESNVLASNSQVNILLLNVDDKSKGKTEPDDKDVIKITDSEKESITSKKIVQPTAAEIEAYKVTVSVPVDISKLPLLVPEGKQDPNFLYCTMCDKRFKQKRHQQEHIKKYCSYLMEKVKIQRTKRTNKYLVVFLGGLSLHLNHLIA